VLGLRQLHPRPGDQRHRRAVHRHVLLRPVAATATTLALLLIASCGGADTGDDQSLVAALGDSITAGNPGYDPHPATRRRLGLGNNPRSQWEWWAQKEHPELEFRNCGVRGERTDEIARRLVDCVVGADAVVIQGGINDLAAGLPPRAVLANLRGMVRAAKEEHLDVALADLLPYGPAPQIDPVIDRLNRRITVIGRSMGVTVLPFHRALEDPGHPGTMKPEWTADGIHPSVEGYRRLGQLALSPPSD
jgi:lysophospholipase L1-like esterase